MSSYQNLMKEIGSLSGDLYRKDFLLTWEKSIDEIKKIMAVAEALRWLRRENLSSRCFDSGLAVSIFRDKSTRTRFSFFKAANLLGLGVQDLDEGRSQIAHGETVRETANMISFFTEVIGIRDDIFLGAGHTYMQEVAAALAGRVRAGGARAAADRGQSAVRPRPPHPEHGRPAAPQEPLRRRSRSCTARSWR